MNKLKKIIFNKSEAKKKYVKVEQEKLNHQAAAMPKDANNYINCKWSKCSHERTNIFQTRLKITMCCLRRTTTKGEGKRGK